METEALLFLPFQLGSFTLRNRIVMAPLTRARSNDDGVPRSSPSPSVQTAAIRFITCVTSGIRDHTG